jgi:amphi-Trp domain-containing protein
MARKQDRDVERLYTAGQFAAKLRRMADAIDQGRSFEIIIAGERVRVPLDAEFCIEHEREGDEQELEFTATWKKA